MKTSFPVLIMAIILLLPVACNNKETATEIVRSNNCDVYITHVDQIRDTIDMKLSELLIDCELIPLETLNESLISFAHRVAVSENYIAIKDSEKTPLKLFTRDGKYIRDIGAIGRGPDEYNISLYGVQIDEENESLYLLPFAQARKILVFGFDGKAKKHIPLRFQQRKFKAYVENDIVTIIGMPFKNDTALVYQQTTAGELIQYIAPKEYQLAMEFSSEVSSSKNAGSYDLFQMLWSKTPSDTLYHYDTQANKLIPKCTFVFDSEEWPLYVCYDLPNHYYGWIYKRGNIIVDKSTLETSYFKLVNDFFGGIELKTYYQSNNGIFISNISALNLKREINRCLDEGNLSAEMTDKLKDIDADITENSNDILFVGKFKK